MVKWLDSMTSFRSLTSMYFQDFGFLRPSTQNVMQNYFNSQFTCAANNTTCLNGLNISSIITAGMETFQTAFTLDPAAGQGEPLRPLLDGSFISAPLDLSGEFPTQIKPLLITTVAQEAGLTIYGLFPQPLPEPALGNICSATFGPNRTGVILANPLYVPPNGSHDIRPQLEEIGTDSMWRCSSWSFARSWVQNGGTAFVGKYVVGASYPGNGAVSYCSQPGIVCHQDDIEIVVSFRDLYNLCFQNLFLFIACLLPPSLFHTFFFPQFGTVPNPTTAQSALISQIQSSYKAFLNNGNPNGDGLPKWTPATSSDVHPLLLGGSGEAPVGACTPSFWGAQVKYDYQVYNP